MISEITPAIFFYSYANKKQSTSMDNKYRDMLSKLLNKFVKMKKKLNNSIEILLKIIIFIETFTQNLKSV